MAVGTPTGSRLDSFTNRESILADFQHLLRSVHTGEFHLLAVKGNGGTGKTFLIEYLSQRICPAVGWQTGVLAFAQSTPDFRSILDGVEGALKGCVPHQSLKQYRIQREEYKSRFDEYRASITVSQHLEAKDSSSISHIQMTVQVDAELRRREVQLRAELTRALLELAEECEHPLCLFYDGYERLAETDPELTGWLWEEVLLNLPKNAPKPVLAVTCGWDTPSNPAVKPFAVTKELDDFDLVRLKSYLEKQGVINADSSSSEQEELVTAFYELTKGHPLVLSVALTYFNTLEPLERTAHNLRADRPLVDERARVEFLEERLLSRLQEPYRTLVEWGPILRFFDQATLQLLLSTDETGSEVDDEISKLDDRTYDRFLQYPFISQVRMLTEDLPQVQFAFHELVRWVALSALRRLHPETKEQLHCKMSNYYGNITFAEQQGEALVGLSLTDTDVEPTLTYSYPEWVSKILEKKLKPLLECLYHGLQVKDLQVDALKAWEVATGYAINSWQHHKAGLLLGLVHQLEKEDELFLNRTSDSYGRYMMWYSRFLEQEARWEEAREVLENAVKIFEQVGSASGIVSCLNNIGYIYEKLGKLEQALQNFERALAVSEQVDTPHSIALSLNNIGLIYQRRGILERALNYYIRALTLSEQADDPRGIAHSLNNIGVIYDMQGEWDQSLSYYERALALREQIGHRLGIAISLNNIGEIYRQVGQWQQALNYHKRALAIREQVGNPLDISNSLNNIGFLHQLEGRFEVSLSYYERALALREQVGNPLDISTTLCNIAEVYRQQHKLDQALSYYERALALREQVGNPHDIALLHNWVGSIYHLQGELELALGHYERTIALLKEEDSLNAIAGTFINIGTIYQQQMNLEEAIKHYARALSLYKHLGNGFEELVSYLTEAIATCYAELGKHTKKKTNRTSNKQNYKKIKKKRKKKTR